MPHRTTYFFPRQFPDRQFDQSSKQLLEDHEKKVSTATAINAAPTSTTTTSTITTTTTSKDTTTVNTFQIESDRKPSKQFSVSSKASAVSQLFAGHGKSQHTKQQQQHFAAFCDWLAEKKAERTAHAKPHRYSTPINEFDSELLLPPAPESVDRNFDRQVSLPRVSSGSSYAGSLFSGTTLDGNLSSDVVKDSGWKVSSSSSARHEEEEERDQKNRESLLVQKTKEGYYLKLALAKRLTSQACLDHTEPLLMQVSGPESSNAEIVSYRLWVRRRYALMTCLLNIILSLLFQYNIVSLFLPFLFAVRPISNWEKSLLAYNRIFDFYFYFLIVFVKTN